MQIPWYIHFCFLMENWDGGLDKNTVKNEGPTKETISLLQFYTYRLAVRQTLSPIFHSGKVFQQYIVDAYVRMEAARLHYIWQNWSNLHVEIYLGLLDHVNTRAEEFKLSTWYKSSSFQGSPRAMQQNFQGAMAIVAKYGRPDIFLTFTCNPEKPDIVKNLLDGQRPKDRPDITSRLFHLHLKELLTAILKRHVLGVVVAHIYVTKFQKRGLPHARLLLILADSCKLRNPSDIDNVISAEIPDSNTESQL